mmetsp:Transcript_18289/g.32864  ORF Transcript_18289/g.32864 Transcript_18289/m.32864 type:complete len:403 (-) Transcript_18289:69-1277(-)
MDSSVEPCSQSVPSSKAQAFHIVKFQRQSDFSAVVPPPPHLSLITIQSDFNKKGDKLNPDAPCFSFETESDASTCLSSSPSSFNYSPSSVASDEGTINWAFTDLVKLCKTSAGSKKVQQSITGGCPTELEFIVNSILEGAHELMVDQYANYMCQTLVQSISSTLRLRFLQSLAGHLVSIAMDPRGTHSLQALISLCSLPQEELVYMRDFGPHVLDLAIHPNAAHVLQKLVLTVKKTSFITDLVAYRARKLSCDKLGVCLVKKCLGVAEIYFALEPHILDLAQDPYGNYAVQTLIEMWSPQCYSSIIKQFSGRVAQLSIQKYASNVINTCIGKPGLAEPLVYELLCPEKLQILLPSPFGIQILQSISATRLKNELKQALLRVMPSQNKKRLKPHLETVEKLLN